MGWAIFGRGDRPAVMTLRVLALVLAVALALPRSSSLAAARPSPGATAAAPARHRRLEALWVVVPIALLAALVGFAVAA